MQNFGQIRLLIVAGIWKVGSNSEEEGVEIRLISVMSDVVWGFRMFWLKLVSWELREFILWISSLYLYLMSSSWTRTLGILELRDFGLLGLLIANLNTTYICKIVNNWLILRLIFRNAIVWMCISFFFWNYTFQEIFENSTP